jgi:hypothetical protein
MLVRLTGVMPSLITAGPADILCSPDEAAAAGWWDSLADFGIYALMHDPEGAPLGYADPVAETREGRQIAVAYALGTQIERDAAVRTAQWAASAKARARTQAQRTLDTPMPSNPTPTEIQARIDALNTLQRITP